MSKSFFFDALPIIIATFSLFVSFLSYLNSRRATILSLEQYEQTQLEKKFRRFDITTYRTDQDEVFTSYNPFDMWAVKLLVNNKGNEPVLLSQLYITLSFRGKYQSLWHKFLHRMLGSANDPRRRCDFTFGMVPQSFQVEGDIPGLVLSSDLFKKLQNVYITNWETKKLIIFRENQSFRGPSSGQKEIWMVFGKIPKELSSHLKAQGFSLINVRFDFITDQGEINNNVSFLPHKSISDSLRKEIDEIINK